MAGNNEEKPKFPTLIQVDEEVYLWLRDLKQIEQEPFNSVLLRIKSGEIKKW
jgi:predicted CopG family antitoxin